MAMPSPEDGATTKHDHGWQNLFSQHMLVLKEHLGLWTSIQNQQIPTSKEHGAARSCMDQTQEMIKNFETLSSTLSHEPLAHFTKSTSNESLQTVLKHNANPSLEDSTEALSLRPSKRRRAEDTAQERVLTTHAVEDPSGLFTIDTNPTPVEELMSRATNGVSDPRPNKRSKKTEPKHKKSLKESTKETTRADRKEKSSKPKPVQDTTTPTVEPSGQVEAENDNVDQEAFIAKVNKRHQEKEEKRKRKLDKKRKRESNTSVEEPRDPPEPDRAEKRKKKRLKHDEAAVATISQPPNDQVPTNQESTRKRASSKGRDKAKRQKKA